MQQLKIADLLLLPFCFCTASVAQRPPCRFVAGPWLQLACSAASGICQTHVALACRLRGTMDSSVFVLAAAQITCFVPKGFLRGLRLSTHCKNRAHAFLARLFPREKIPGMFTSCPRTAPLHRRVKVLASCYRQGFPHDELGCSLGNGALPI